MGTEYFLCFIFDEKPENVEWFISSMFKVRLRKPDESDKRFMEFERVEFTKKGLWKYPVTLVKKGGLWPDDPLKTADPDFKPVEYFDLRLFKVGGYSLLELNPQPRKSWMFVKSSELLKFLKPFLERGVLLVAGYNDSIDLTRIGLEEDDENLLFMELVSIVEERKRVLPSGVTVVRNDFLPLEDGLYELVGVDEEKEYVLIKSLGEYKIIVSVEEFCLVNEECYQDLLEDKAWFSLSMTGVVFKRIGKKVEDEFLIKRAEEYFKAQVKG